MTSFSSSYTATTAPGQQLFVSHQNGQTQLTIASSTAGQQQSQSSSFTTGSWRSAPALYCTANGVILQICGQQGDTWIQLQGQQVQKMGVPVVAEVDRVELQPANPPAMQPLPPMQMEGMEMQPMQMQMQMQTGNMEMQMGKPAPAPTSAKFCSECGQPAESGDRFCANCGHQLSR